MERISVLLSVHRALLGVITSTMRSITVGYKTSPFILRVYFEQPPFDNDLDLLNEATGEILADFKDLSDIVIDPVVTQDGIHQLPCLDEWVYIRYEAE